MEFNTDQFFCIRLYNTTDDMIVAACTICQTEVEFSSPTNLINVMDFALLHHLDHHSEVNA